MSRKLILFVALSGLVSTAMAQTTVAPAIPRDENIEKKVEALLEKMTLEEKIGQMTELTIDVITKRDNPTKEFQIDDALLDTVIGKYKVGSILNVPQGIAQSKEKWEEIIKKIQDKSMKTMGIPLYLWSRPDTWDHLYVGRYFLPPRYQYGGYFQPGTGS